MAASRAREDRARARRAGATGSAAHPAGLAPKRCAHTKGLADRPPLSARPRGRRRLLRLPPSFRRPSGLRRGRRYGQGRAGSAGDGQYLRDAEGCGPELGLLARRGDERVGRDVGTQGLVDPKSGSLSYANAGHDLPYLRHSGGDAEELRARGMPLGLMPGMSDEEKETILEAGDSVLFYSDGLV